MALFKPSNPEKTMQCDIDAVVKTRERLSAQIAEFEQAIMRHAAAAKQAALTGDDATLTVRKQHCARHRTVAPRLKAALTEVAQQLEALERSKAEIADRKVRAETAAEIELLVRKLTEVGAGFNSTAVRLSKHTVRAVPVVFDALGLDKFMTICRAEVPAAVEMVSKLLRALADAVVAGTAPAKLPRPAEASVSAPAQPEKPHFTYRPMKAEPSYKGFVAR